MASKDDQPELKPTPPEPANKSHAGVPPAADKPCYSSPCLLDSDEDFNPDYLPDYSRDKK